MVTGDNTTWALERYASEDQADHHILQGQWKRMPHFTTEHYIHELCNSVLST